jgi:hypothetical protein
VLVLGNAAAVALICEKPTPAVLPALAAQPALAGAPA